MTEFRLNSSATIAPSDAVDSRCVAVGRGRRVSPPAGTAAFLLGEATRRRYAEERIVAGLVSAGFLEAMVPSADYLAPYAPHLNAREERELYRFVDRHGDTLALRADFTIALARHLGPRISPGSQPMRVFYRGEVLRGNSREGTTVEFYQIGAELLGDRTDAADVEVAALCGEMLAIAGMRQTWFVLSSAGALTALLSSYGTAKTRRHLASAICERRVADVVRLAVGTPPEFAASARRLVEGGIPLDDPLLRQLGAVGKTLERVARRLAQIPGCAVAIDLADSPARSYYTGVFFTVYSRSSGEPIAGGGRYDDLYAAFGAPSPAAGFALGLDGVVLA